MRSLASNGVGTLERDVGSEVYHVLRIAFLGELSMQLAALRDAAPARDVAAARYAAHQIKGSALSFGAVRLDELVGRLLEMGRDQGELLGPVVEEIAHEVGKLRTSGPGPSKRYEHPDGDGDLRGDFGAEVYQQLVEAFLGELSRQLVRLSDAAEVQDIATARYVAHQIKGTASSFTAVYLDELAGRLLQLSREEGELLPTLVDQIDREVRRLQGVLAPAT